VSGSGSSGDITKTRRYAPYIEEHHSTFLDITATRRDIIISEAPFASYNPIEVNAAFFGLGYLISSFPSLYDMFGKHMAGLDIESLWNSTFGKIVGEPSIDVNISEEMKLVDDEMVKGELADFQVSMRNLNAVATSSFVIGKSVAEDKRIKFFANISLEAKAALLPSVEKEYKSHINWEKMTVTVYARAMKNYFMYSNLVDIVNTTFASRASLWPFTVLSFEGAALGTMQSTQSWKKQMDRERSVVSKVLLVASYGVTGALIGSEILPGWGTVIGAVVGIIIGIAIMLLE
jgi:hypothetical protein